MSKRSDSLAKRMAVMRAPKCYPRVVQGLADYLFDYLVRENGEAPAFALFELTQHVARCHARDLAIWKEFMDQELPQGLLLVEEFKFDQQMHLKNIRDSAEALYKLLNERRTPLELSAVLGATEAKFMTPAGELEHRTLERSLLCRLGELITLIEDVHPSEPPHKVKGENAIRQEAIRELLAIWSRVGDGEPKFKRNGSAGGATGPFHHFCDGILKAAGIKTNDLEALIREAVKIWSNENMSLSRSLVRARPHP